MFFTSSKSRVKEIQHYLHKKYKYQRDILGKKKLEILRQLNEDLGKFDPTGLSKDESKKQIKAFEDRCEKLFPESKNAGWHENVEVIFVAIVVALALRTYFLQPFVIPTDSMKPTLYGIPVEAHEGKPPGFFQRVTDYVIFGQTYVYLQIQKGGTVQNISDTGPFGIDLLGYIPFVDRTRVVIGGQSYVLDGTPNEFFRGSELALGFPLQVGDEIADNTVLANYVFGAGDHVFVNKFTYHFRKPERGDVFVFMTSGIREIERTLPPDIKEQFYIKRCVGLPGDELRVEPPYLLNNGKALDSRPIFEKIYSMKDGYRGYGTHVTGRRGEKMFGHFLRVEGEPFTVPQNSYWAMGDNSYASSDSRFWGVVPQENLVGTGFLVYWPISKRWGLIK